MVVKLDQRRGFVVCFGGRRREIPCISANANNTNSSWNLDLAIIGLRFVASAARRQLREA